jgi:Fic family protein
MLFETPKLDEHDTRVIEEVDELRRVLQYAMGGEPKRWTGLLRRVAFARAIRGSNTIEGYNVTVDDAIAAAEGEDPLDASAEAWAAVRGYRQAMTYVLQLADDPHFAHSVGLLRSLHYMMLQHDLAKGPGKWRRGPIFVRDEEKHEPVYEGPPAELVPTLMDELIAELNAADKGTPVLVRAGMAHLNFVMIHPHADGNGRMARCLQTLALAREGILSTHFCSIEEYLGRNTRAYYDVLAAVGGGSWNPSADARPWIRFTLTAHYRQARTLLRRTKEASRLWDMLEQELAQKHLPERVILALADAASGLKVRNATYRSVAEVSDFVASRDLKLLVDGGFLVAHGEKRGRFYVASPSLQSIRAATREPKSAEDPYEILQPRQRSLF